MRIFIAGTHTIDELPRPVKRQISAICDKGWQVLVGDYFGLDLAVQRYLVDMHYDAVTVYAPYGRAYNNLGDWLIKYITPASDKVRLSKSAWKNLAMAESADCGLMLWDGRSPLTLENIAYMARRGKPVTVWLGTTGRLYRLRGPGGLEKLLDLCEKRK